MEVDGREATDILPAPFESESATESGAFWLEMPCASRAADL